MRPYKNIIAGGIPAMVLSLLFPALADVSTDGSLGPAVDFAGPDFVIPESAGARTGGNLFHSFSQFNLTSSQSATFTGGAGIDNVIGRITGGAMSTIDGAVTNAVPGSNLFLLNPDGIVFGGNATINVDGSFYAGTADYLVLGNHEGRFDATNIGDTVLSSAPPSAFGFLAGNPAGISVHGADFNLADGATLGMVGGEILISGADDPLFNPGGTDDYRIMLTDGSFHLAAIDQAAEYCIEPAGDMAIDSWGDVTIREAGLTALGDDYGTVYIRAGRLTLADGFIDTINTGDFDHDAPAIDILAGERFDIEYTGAANFRALLTDATGAGSTGDIRITTGVLNMQGNIGAAAGSGRVLVHSVTQSSAPGGDIDINAGQINLLDNASIQAEAVGTGDAGDIRITAGELSISSTSAAPAFISSNAFNSVGAGGGDIDIQTDSIELLRGNTGFVGITAQGLAATAADRADGGNIQIATGSLLLTGGAQMTTSVFRGTGQAGNIDIQADLLEVAGFSPNGFVSTVGSTSEGAANTSGSAGTVTVTANAVHLRDYGRITTFADTFGNAGDIALTAGTLEVERGAVVSSVNIGAGFAGDIGIGAGSILLSGDQPSGFQTGVFALSGALGAGAGDIDIDADTLDILNGAQINNDTNGAGSGGIVDINTASLTVAGTNSMTGEASQISSRTLPFMNFIDFATGNGGVINIDSDTVTVRDGGLITSASSSQGNGGDIFIAANQLALRDGGGITADATWTGNAGNITVEAGSIAADAGLIATSSLLSAGGDVSILASAFELNDGTTVTSTTGSEFNGGDIVINAGQIRMNGQSRIAASSSGDGDSGDIRLSAASIGLNAASLEATGGGTGLAGNIDLAADDTIMLFNSRIFTEAAQSDGGNITLAATQQVYLKDSTISSSVSDGFGNGGNIGIDPVFVILDNSAIIADANGGDGGNVSIRTDHFIASPGSLVSASSTLGVDGDIVIDTPGNNLSETLDKLPQKAIDTTALISSHCGEIGKGQSSFVVRRNTSAPVNYLAPIGSRYDRDDSSHMELISNAGNKNPSRQCG